MVAVLERAEAVAVRELVPGYALSAELGVGVADHTILDGAAGGCVRLAHATLRIEVVAGLTNQAGAALEAVVAVGDGARNREALPTDLNKPGLALTTCLVVAFVWVLQTSVKLLGAGCAAVAALLQRSPLLTPSAGNPSALNTLVDILLAVLLTLRSAIGQTVTIPIIIQVVSLHAFLT